MRSHSHSPGDIAARLREKSRSLTGPRRAILRLLESEDHPLTPREIHQRLLKAQRCDLATVYRSMHLLLRLGMVQRFDFGDGSARFEWVRPQLSAHHHHLICTGCARVVEIDDCFAAEFEARVAQGSGFTAITHKLEFFGTCPDCQQE